MFGASGMIEVSPEAPCLRTRFLIKRNVLSARRSSWKIGSNAAWAEIRKLFEGFSQPVQLRVCECDNGWPLALTLLS